MGTIMEEARPVRATPLTVQRAFAGSRLEEQILSRVYELVVPLLHKSTHRSQTPRVTEKVVGPQHKPMKTAKGV